MGIQGKYANNKLLGIEDDTYIKNKILGIEDDTYTNNKSGKPKQNVWYNL